MMILSSVRRARRLAIAEAAAAAYTDWRVACAVVGHAYAQWRANDSLEDALAYQDYRAALDREELAAHEYARVMKRAGRLPETAAIHQLARIESSHRDRAAHPRRPVR